MMWSSIKTGAVAFHRSFHSSLVIVFARLQIVLGAAWFVLTATDLAPLIGNPKYVTAWLLFSGIVTETMRRQGTYRDEHNQLIPRPHDDDNVVVNSPAQPVPTTGLTK